MATIIGANTKEYISSLNFLDKRDYLQQVFDVTNESGTLVDILEMTGRVKNTDVPEYIHTENQYLFKAMQIATIAATSGDAAAEDVTFTATTGTDNALPLVGELIMFQNKKIAQVTQVTVASRTVVAKPLNQAVAINASGTEIVANQWVIVFSQAAAEGTDDPSTRQSEWVQSKNNVQIFKQAGEITDLQKVSAVEVNYNGKPYIMYKVQYDTFQRHKMNMSNALFFGEKSSNTDTTYLGGKVYTTQGLRKYITSGDGSVKTTGGVVEQYPKASGLAWTGAAGDIRVLSRALDKNQAPDEYMGYIGGDLYAWLDEGLAALEGVKNGINYSAFGTGDAKKRAIDYGFDSFRLYGRTFHIQKLKILDHKGLFGAGSSPNLFDFSYEGYFVPQDKIKVDAGGGTSDRMLLRVMSGDGTNFYPHMETVTGKLAPTPTNTKSVLHISYQTIAGLQVCGTEHFAMLQGT